MAAVIDTVEINIAFEQCGQRRWVAACMLTHPVSDDHDRPRRPTEGPTIGRNRDFIRPRKREATFRDHRRTHQYLRLRSKSRAVRYLHLVCDNTIIFFSSACVANRAGSSLRFARLAPIRTGARPSVQNAGHLITEFPTAVAILTLHGIVW